MNPALFFYLDSSDEESNEVPKRIARKALRDRSDPLSLPDIEFVERFGLNRNAFDYLLTSLEFSVRTSAAVPPVLQLVALLALLRSGGIQASIGCDYLIGMSQSEVSRLTANLLKQIEENMCPKHIKFLPENSARCQEWFYQKFKIPNVIGCIDNTLIGLQMPSVNGELYLDQNGEFSLNAMIICDHQHNICAVNAKYGGATHDSFVWQHCDQRKQLEELFRSNEFNNLWLLGDSAYPAEPWCITPYIKPKKGSVESAFNEIHSNARRIIERTIGVLKVRWGILRHDKRGRYAPEKVERFINVCCALHNICNQFKVPLTQKIILSACTVEAYTGEETQLTRRGHYKRKQIMRSLLGG